MRSPHAEKTAPSLSLPTDCLCEPQLLGFLATEAWQDSSVKAHKMWVPKCGSCLSLAKILAQNPSLPVLWVCSQLSQDADCGVHVTILGGQLENSIEGTFFWRLPSRACLLLKPFLLCV